MSLIYEILLFESIIGRFSFLNTLLLLKIDTKCENEITNVNPINFILYVLDLTDKEGKLFWSKKMYIFPLTLKLISYPQTATKRVSLLFSMKAEWQISYLSISISIYLSIYLSIYH